MHGVPGQLPLLRVPRCWPECRQWLCNRAEARQGRFRTDAARLTRRQLPLLLLVWGTHFEKRCSRPVPPKRNTIAATHTL